MALEIMVFGIFLFCGRPVNKQRPNETASGHYVGHNKQSASVGHVARAVFDAGYIISSAHWPAFCGDLAASFRNCERRDLSLTSAIYDVDSYQHTAAGDCCPGATAGATSRDRTSHYRALGSLVSAHPAFQGRQNSGRPWSRGLLGSPRAIFYPELP